MVCTGWSSSAPGARVNCLQPTGLRSVRAISCPNSGGSSTSGQPKRLSSVRARSCPISGGSTFSLLSRRSSLVRACSCPIWGGSTSRGSRLLDAVTAPRDAFPRAWALAIGPRLRPVIVSPLLQRRARRPHRPQRFLVRIRHLRFTLVSQSTSAWYQLAAMGGVTVRGDSERTVSIR
eukprot:scaffold30971_cov51-Phaeocystis_antarctica.AAC.2